MARSKSLKRLFWLALIGMCLFVPAGTFAWPGAWIFLLLFVGGMFVTMGWLKRHDPALFEERLRSFGRQPDQPVWDKAFGLAMGAVWYGWLVVMSFEARESAGTPIAALAAGAALMAAGYLLIVQCFKANTFAATVVRLQAERGQKVVDRGPYALVRHPMYSASILIHIGTAALLGARLGLAVLPLLAVMLAVRAVLEERLLCSGLPGYAEYAVRVRWRLVPGLW
jgi:protein-S-isoprenylcysteine O-methyltransferase Ste14